jgi:hypothetical protein
MKRTLTAADIGIAIRDFLEDKEAEIIDWSQEDPASVGSCFINAIDVSDAVNPVIYTADGLFRVSIVKVE